MKESRVAQREREMTRNSTESSREANKARGVGEKVWDREKSNTVTLSEAERKIDSQMMAAKQRSWGNINIKNNIGQVGPAVSQPATLEKDPNLSLLHRQLSSRPGGETILAEVRRASRYLCRRLPRGELISLHAYSA